MTQKTKFLSLAVFLLLLSVIAIKNRTVQAAGPASAAAESYRVLEPIQSGNLLLFPVVRSGSKALASTSFLTLDEGLKSGEVEVTEAGKVQGLVRPRNGHVGLDANRNAGDQVNTLVLLNHSAQPLLLLAGEIVTGGKQDRVIAKDRIVPAGSDPVDLSVFCIEPGRWTESSAKFGVAAKGKVGSFMVQPSIRDKAMVAKDQQQVWSAVGGAISTMSAAAAPRPNASAQVTVSGTDAIVLSTSSYAKAMQNEAVSSKVEEAAPVARSREQVIEILRQQHAVGVVVAVRGEIVWADIFADTDLLSRYWTKLIRSYAAESLTPGESRPAPSVADAQRFLDSPSGGSETSNGEVGVYRFSEVKADSTDTFILESLMPPSNLEVHISKLKLLPSDLRSRAGIIIR